MSVRTERRRSYSEVRRVRLTGLPPRKVRPPGRGELKLFALHDSDIGLIKFSRRPGGLTANRCKRPSGRLRIEKQPQFNVSEPGPWRLPNRFMVRARLVQFVTASIQMREQVSDVIDVVLKGRHIVA
jgi:hypothetical protein